MEELIRYFRKYIWFYGAVIALFTGGAFLTTEAVETMAEVSLDSSRTVVIVDPGHGGEDGGAVSCSGIPESRFNLEISLRLNDLLHLVGIPTEMTRREDVSIHTKGETIAARKISDLKNRTALVNDVPRGLLVSIHQNRFEDSRYRGAQVFYSPGAGSRELAEKMQADLIQHLDPDSRRAAKPAKGVYLMDHIRCPGILVECGFLSNPEEERLLASPDYQKELVCVMSSVLSRHMLP